MGRLLDAKKESKRQSLLVAAYELFLERGAAKTSVGDITERAGVAKGTFYLYFTDKANLLEALCFQISYDLMGRAYEAMQQHRQPEFWRNTVFLVDYLVDYFCREKVVLRLIERNFSWPLMEEKLTRQDDPLFSAIWQDASRCPALAGRSRDEALRLLFALFEMCGSTCYSSIILGRPAGIEQMKPVMYYIIRRCLDGPAGELAGGEAAADAAEASDAAEAE